MENGHVSTSSGELEFEVVVTSRAVVAEDIVEIRVQRADGELLPAWEAGAHIDLLLEHDLVRQYSLCGDPADLTTWRVAVLREKAGSGGSEFVHDKLAEGTHVGVRGPRNHFRLEPASAYVFVAGGIGITPILPMLKQASATGTPWTMFYGGRSISTMAYLDELADYGDGVKVVPQDREGLLTVDEIVASAPRGSVIYCCGPTALLDVIETRARSHGVPLRLEHFVPKEVGEPVLHESFEVHLEQMGVTLTVPPDRSILDVVEEAGAFVITSCREGTCGSCETPVLEGIPDHRDSLLSRDITDSMLICVSRSACPRLVLDL